MIRRRAVVAALLASFLLNAPAMLAQQPTPSPTASPVTPTASTVAAQQAAPAVAQNDPVARIRDEGMNRSQVMRVLNYLTDVIGPRLTASPGMRRANEWTRDELTRFGLQNARLEPWGPFGRGWTLRRFSAQVSEPQSIPLIAYPKAWSPGTNGAVTAEVIHLDASDQAALERFRGRLRGAIVLYSPVRELRAAFDPLGTRLTDAELLTLANAPDPATVSRRQFQVTPEQRAAAEFAVRRFQFLHDEGAAVIIDSSRAGSGGTVFVQQAAVPQPFDTPQARRISAWDRSAPRILPQVTIASEQYNRIVRMLQAGERVRMTVDIDVQFQDQDLMGYNTVAEIPGTDLREQVVMLGAHMDSWHAGTGATDNAAGCAVMMEAVRILRALNLQPRRTIRIALWSGEEQGLLGSRAYVAEHFGSMTPTLSATPPAAGATPPARLVTKPEYEQFSAYFNLDNGTGRIRGVYMQGNNAVAPIFRRWLAPFRDAGASTLTLANTGGTDHLAFDAIGLPGFQFIQDEIEYGTRTHHSNQDVFDRIQADDMRQAATIVAAFIYNAAMMDERIPRKPAPGR